MNLIERIKKASLALISSIAIASGASAYEGSSIFSELNSLPPEYRMDRGKIVTVYGLKDFPHNQQQQTLKFQPEDYFNPINLESTQLENYFFTYSAADKGFFNAINALLQKYSHEMYSKDVSALDSKDSILLISKLVADSKVYGNFIAYGSSGEEKFRSDFEESLVYPDYFGRSVYGSYLKREAEDYPKRVQDYLDDKINPYFDTWGNINKMFAMKYGVCRHYTALTCAFFNHLKLYNKNLSNSYVLYVSSDGMSHAFNMLADITADRINIAFVDVTYYDNESGTYFLSDLDAVDEEHFVEHPENKDKVYRFIRRPDIIRSTSGF